MTFASELETMATDAVDTSTGLGLSVVLAAPDPEAFDFSTMKPDFPTPSELLSVGAARSDRGVSGRGSSRVRSAVYRVSVSELAAIDADAKPAAGWTVTDSGTVYDVVSVALEAGGTIWNILAEVKA